MINNIIAVAAIDFGTTYSGYAYAFKTEYEKDSLKIYTNDVLIGMRTSSSKEPTIVLFDAAGNFHSFGYQAQQHYANLADEDKHHGWKYFQRFKMELNRDSGITKNIKLRDDQGGEMRAMVVFSAVIKFLKDHLLEKARIPNLTVANFHWMLTVPAIWNDGAKQFMKKAALKAGIPFDKLTLALEPEAAAAYCKELAMQKSKDNENEIKCFDQGSQFMVLDLGGGTADITVHEIHDDGSLIELIPPSGGPWGSMNVNANVNKFLEDVFTTEVMDDFQKESKVDQLELENLIEIKKRGCRGKNEQNNQDMRLVTVLQRIYTQKHGTDIKETISNKSLDDRIKVKRGSIYVTDDLIIEKFQEPTQNIIDHVERLLRDTRLKNVNMLLLVGGFSESDIIRQTIRSKFEPKIVIAPEQAGVAVVKGAVILGYHYLKNTHLIKSRILSHTYGIRVCGPIDVSNRPEEFGAKRHQLWENGKCPYIFYVFIKAGSTVVPGETKVKHAFIAETSSPTLTVYKSKNKDPVYTYAPGCQEIGKIQLQLPCVGKNTRTRVEVSMSFGGTELTVEANEHGNKKQIPTKLDFLNVYTVIDNEDDDDDDDDEGGN